MILTDFTFLAIAKAAHERGFPVIPIDPVTKKGNLWYQFKNPATTMAEIEQAAKAFPKHRVGVVGRRIVGELVILDIDAEGVRELIEADGNKLDESMTHVVYSRSVTDRSKQHWYFRHTPYSVSQFDKEIHVFNLKVALSNGRHPILFDVQGAGRGGFVVAEGSWREDTQEIYEGNDLPVADIPDWLVNRLLAIRAEYRSGVAREKIAKRKKLDAVISKGERITRDEVQQLITSRVRSYAATGMSKRLIVESVEEQIVKFAGKDKTEGAALAREYRDRIRQSVNKLSKKNFGRPRRIFLPTIQLAPGVLLNTRGLKHHEVLSRAISHLPSGLWSSDIRNRMESALSRQGLTLAAGQVGARQIQRALTRAGRTITAREGNERRWS